MTRLKTLKWKDIVKSKLYHDQAGKCLDCSEPITSEWQKHVKYRIPIHRGGPADYDNLKLVHRDCEVVKRKPQADRAKIITTLFEQGISLDSIARALGISVKTVYRYIKLDKNALAAWVNLPIVREIMNISSIIQPPDIHRIFEAIDTLRDIM